MDTKLAALVKHNHAEELVIRHKNQKLTTEIQSQIQKYDTDVSAKTKEVNDAKASYEGQNASLEDLKNSTETLGREWDAIEDKRIREEQEREELERLRNSAATKIQAGWKGYWERKMLKVGKSCKGLSASNMFANSHSLHLDIGWRQGEERSKGQGKRQRKRKEIVSHRNITRHVATKRREPPLHIPNADRKLTSYHIGCHSWLTLTYWILRVKIVRIVTDSVGLASLLEWEVATQVVNWKWVAVVG